MKSYSFLTEFRAMLGYGVGRERSHMLNNGVQLALQKFPTAKDLFNFFVQTKANPRGLQPTMDTAHYVQWLQQNINSVFVRKAIGVPITGIGLAFSKI